VRRDRRERIPELLGRRHHGLCERRGNGGNRSSAGQRLFGTDHGEQADGRKQYERRQANDADLSGNLHDVTLSCAGNDRGRTSVQARHAQTDALQRMMLHRREDAGIGRLDRDR
jgi:hypothetical protein